LDRVRSSIGSGVSFQVGFWDEPDFGVSLQLRPDFESGYWAESRDFGVNLEDHCWIAGWDFGLDPG